MFFFSSATETLAKRVLSILIMYGEDFIKLIKDVIRTYQ